MYKTQASQRKQSHRYRVNHIFLFCTLKLPSLSRRTPRISYRPAESWVCALRDKASTARLESSRPGWQDDLVNHYGKINYILKSLFGRLSRPIMTRFDGALPLTPAYARQWPLGQRSNLKTQSHHLISFEISGRRTQHQKRLPYNEIIYMSGPSSSGQNCVG